MFNSGLHLMILHSTPAPLPQIAQEPLRPPQASPAQESARPVQPAARGEPASEQAQRQGAGERRGQRGEISEQEQRELAQLKARDREVRQHEAAHKNAAGQHARGGASFSYQNGPDGRRYAVGGEVDIDMAPVPGDPQATLEKARTIRQAALAPAQPSAQDRQVAAEAARMEQQARQELLQAREAAAEPADRTTDGEPGRPEGTRGAMLDVFA